MAKWISFINGEKGSAVKNWLDFVIFSLILVLVGANVIYCINGEVERSLPDCGMILVLVDTIAIILLVVMLILRQREE
jgi:hypothetical protein